MPIPERRLFLLLIAIMAWSTAMLIEAAGINSPDFRPSSDCYFSGKPILDLELAQTPVCFQSVATQGIDQGHKHNLSLIALNTYLDFVFIALYWMLFLTLAQIEGSGAARFATAL